MPEPIRYSAALLSIVCGALLVPVDAPADAGAGTATLGQTIEMSGHRRLLEVMEKAGFTPAPFTTDGCSGGMSATWGAISGLLSTFSDLQEERPPWEPCCVAHDRIYHDAGGARSADESYRARLAADEVLRACVIGTGADRTSYLTQTFGLTDSQVAAAYEKIADAMYEAVRLGGGPCSGLPWRWGFGYPGCLLGD